MSTWQLCSSYPVWHWTNTQKSSSKPFWEALALSSHTHKCTKKKSPTLFSRMFLLTFPLGNDYQKKKRWTMVPTCSACSSNQLGSSARSSQKIAEPRASGPRCWPLAVGVFFFRRSRSRCGNGSGCWVFTYSLENTKENSRNHRKKLQAIVT